MFVPVAFSCAFSFGESLAKGGFDYFRRPVVAVFEQVSVHAEGDGRGGVTEAAAHGDRVQTGGDQLAGVGVAESVQTYRRQLEFC